MPTDETTFINNDAVESKNKDTSHLFNISLRGWLCLIVVSTVCIMSYKGVEVKEPLYTAATMMLGFYFAQNKQESGKAAVKGQ